MNIVDATNGYERWLGSTLTLLSEDLATKHKNMAKSAFRFLRATFYRWMQQWRENAGDLGRASTVLSIGDLHVENFGTWRDAEGRLVWGANDFDEAYPLPWTHDVVRLATSAHLACEEDRLEVGRGDACDAILDGYTQALDEGGAPFILAERNEFLTEIALGAPRAAGPFWQDFQDLPDAPAPRAELSELLTQALPESSTTPRFVHRVAGLGSLGRERIAAVAGWRGGLVAREVKALAPSAAAWAYEETSGRCHGAELLAAAVRCHDPFVRITERWVVRRLAPDCFRIDLKKLPDKRDERRLLWSMGYETANVHLGTAGARDQIRSELRALAPRWLHETAKMCTRRVNEDWDAWRKHVG